MVYQDFFTFLEEAVYNAPAICKNYHPNLKYLFMILKLEVILNILVNSGSLLESLSEFHCLNGCHFSKAITGTEKRKIHKKTCRFSDVNNGPSADMSTDRFYAIVDRINKT